jgi:hypothetical protein
MWEAWLDGIFSNCVWIVKWIFLCKDTVQVSTIYMKNLSHYKLTEFMDFRAQYEEDIHVSIFATCIEEWNCFAFEW